MPKSFPCFLTFCTDSYYLLNFLVCLLFVYAFNHDSEMHSKSSYLSNRFHEVHDVIKYKQNIVSVKLNT